jgi:hypothetical protein
MIDEKYERRFQAFLVFAREKNLLLNLDYEEYDYESHETSLAREAFDAGYDAGVLSCTDADRGEPR